MATVAFLHAHPDDEAIFSGGTISALASAGHAVVLVVATSGELGVDDTETEAPEGPGVELGAARRSEVELAAEILGVRSLHHLDYRDSGLAGDPANDEASSFWSADPTDAAERVVAILRAEAVDTLVVYDDHGIYGHPDHVKGHQVGLIAAELAGTRWRYEMTVDREYLHFVETHLVEDAALAGDLGLARSGIGTPSVEVDLTLDVRAHLRSKREAMAAHISQLPEHSPVFGLAPEHFEAVYGWEWYRRLGPAGGPLDELGTR